MASRSSIDPSISPSGKVSSTALPQGVRETEVTQCQIFIGGVGAGGGTKVSENVDTCLTFFACYVMLLPK
jgi:hypothetical protein